MTEGAPRPYTLVAELTYRCPLRCVYCSNPLDYASHGDALGTADWLRVFREAEALGVVQLNLTGGEPLVRDDLEELVEGARALDLYTNLITSGIPCTRERLERLKACGLDNVQVSVQDVRAPESDRIAGLRSFERKLEVARLVKELGLPLTINTVLHRENLDRVPEVIALAESLHADRLELANTQYLGWALVNRRALLPTREQLDRAREVARSARQRLARQHGSAVRDTGLLRGVPEIVHGRLGAAVHRDLPRRARTALPRRAHIAGAVVRPRPGPAARRDLASFGCLQRVPRRGVDAGALPELRPPDRRLRGLPLPGVSSDGQRGRDGSRLLARAGSCADRHGARWKRWRRASPRSSIGPRGPPHRRDTAGGLQHLDPPRAGRRRGRGGDRAGCELARAGHRRQQPPPRQRLGRSGPRDSCSPDSSRS